MLSLNETPVFTVHGMASRLRSRAPSTFTEKLAKKNVRMKNVCTVYWCIYTEYIHVINGEMVFNTITVQVRVRDRICAQRKWPIYILMACTLVHCTYLSSKLENGSFDSRIKCIKWLCCRQQ